MRTSGEEITTCPNCGGTNGTHGFIHTRFEDTIESTRIPAQLLRIEPSGCPESDIYPQIDSRDAIRVPRAGQTEFVRTCLAFVALAVRMP